MRVSVHIPGPLRPFADGQRRLSIEGPGNVRELLARLPSGLRERVLNEQGEVRLHVNVFVGDTSIRETGRLDTPLRDGDVVHIIPAVSGG